MMNDVNIKWFDVREEPVEGICLGCQTHGPMKLVCEVTNLFSPDSHLSFAQCSHCVSLTVIKGDLFDFTDSEMSAEG
jgi:hypothetical protein